MNYCDRVEAQQSLLLKDEFASDEKTLNPPLWLEKTKSRFMLGQILFFLISSAIFITGLNLHIQRILLREDLTPISSPAREAVTGTESFRRFDRSFRPQTIYASYPNSTVDEAWNRITLPGAIVKVPIQTLFEVGIPPQTAVQLPGGGGEYMASIEALHQLHCLNLLRQATYPEYYRTRSPAWRDSPETLRVHMDHRFDNLRQKLMCDADPEVLTYVWAKGRSNPFPDFGVQHRCRNFEALRDWVEANRVDMAEIRWGDIA